MTNQQAITELSMFMDSQDLVHALSTTPALILYNQVFTKITIHAPEEYNHVH